MKTSSGNKTEKRNVRKKVPLAPRVCCTIPATAGASISLRTFSSVLGKTCTPPFPSATAPGGFGFTSLLLFRFFVVFKCNFVDYFGTQALLL